MKVKIQKWEDDLALRIPESLTADLNIREGSTIGVTIRHGRLAVESAAELDYTLEELLAGVTERNLHAEIDGSDIE
jgi:antitoxin MazE